MSREQSLVHRSPLRKRASQDLLCYVGDLENARDADSTLGDSVGLFHPTYGSAENRTLSEVAHEPKLFFVCQRCDMLVGEKDKFCQFCGAEFIEGEISEIDEASQSIDEPKIAPNEVIDEPAPPRSRSSFPVSANRVDVLSLLADGRSRLGVEHLAGGSSFAFANHARVLRKMEIIINEASDFGAETEEARRMLLSAWKACHEGKWNRAMRLADEVKRILAPGVTHLVQGQISCLREAIIEMKRNGRIVTPLVIEIKTIQRALDELRMDDAIRLTKTLISEIKQAQMHLLDSMDSSPSSTGDAFCGQGI